MGITKTHHFTEGQNEIATVLKALAHPARIAIIEYLLSVETCICNDIVAEINLAQPTVSQHLKELKNAGIIQGEVESKVLKFKSFQEIIIVKEDHAIFSFPRNHRI